MSDERPLGLAELAEIDSPEIVRTALSRFRRRMFVRAVLIPAAVAAIVFVPRLLPGTDKPTYRQYEESRLGRIVGVRLLSGPVDVVVLDAKRLEDRLVAVRILVTTDQLQGRERLAIEQGDIGVIRSCEPLAQRRGVPSAPISIQPIQLGALGSPTPDVAEVLMVCPVGTRRATLEIGAIYRADDYYDPSGGLPPPGGEAKGPGTHTQEECAVPLNELGVCAMTKREGSYRTLAMVTVDLEQLGVPPEIWRDEP